MSGQRIEDCENNTKAAWYENHYDCSECNAAWTDDGRACAMIAVQSATAKLSRRRPST